MFGIYPVSDNGSGLRGLPLNQWPNNQTLIIESIQLGRFLNPPPGVYYSNKTVPLNDNATLNYKVESPVKYIVWINNINGSKPILLVFHQNYNKYWEIRSNNGILNYTPLILNNNTQAFLIYPEKNFSNLTITVYFKYQDYLNLFYYTIILIYILFIGTIIILNYFKKHKLSYKII
jgi:hypothetical protein